MDLNESVVVITGASSGIGEAVALRCAAKGAQLVLAARSADKLAALEQRIAQAGGRVMAVTTDVTDTAQVQHLADTTLQQHGQVDVLINNAGFGIFDPFINAQFDDLERMMRVNFYGMVHCTRTFVPQMIEHRRGQVINVASIAGIIAMRNMAFYTATKFAVIGFSRSLQHELRSTGVNCAVISPGPVRTNFFEQAQVQKMARLSRLSPWLKAEDVTRAIIRAIEHNQSGEIILPAIMRPLVVMGRAFPGLVKLVARITG